MWQPSTYLIYNYNMCVRACVRPTRQFRVLMDRRNRPGQSDSKNGNRPGQSDSETGTQVLMTNAPRRSWRPRRTDGQGFFFFFSPSKLPLTRTWVFIFFFIFIFFLPLALNCRRCFFFSPSKLPPTRTRFFFFFFALNCRRCCSGNFRIWFSGLGISTLGPRFSHSRFPRSKPKNF
jgi:hypothetical protein